MPIGTITAGAAVEAFDTAAGTTPPIPVGSSSTDLMVIRDVVVHQSAVADAPTTPAGWALLDTFTVTNGTARLRHSWYWRAGAPGGAPTMALTGTAGTQHRSQMYRIPGAKITGTAAEIFTLGPQADPANSATVMGPITGVTTPEAGCALLVGAVRENDLADGTTIAVQTQQSGFTLALLDTWGAAAGENYAGALAWAVVPTAVAVTAKSFTATAGASQKSIGQMIAVRPAAAVPGTSTIVDTFDAATLGPQWADTYGAVGVETGRAYIDTTHTAGSPNYSGIGSAKAYGFDDVFARVVPQAANGAATGDTYCSLIILHPTISGTRITVSLDVVAGQLQFASQVDFADAGQTVLPYSASTHAWWRMRLVSGQLLWQTSADGSTWTTRRTLATPPTWVTTLDTVELLLDAFRFSGTSGRAYFDNINTVGVSDVTVTDAVPAAVTMGSPAGESVEALSINVDLTDPVPAATSMGSPSGETIDVTVPDTIPAWMLAGAPSGETVAVSVPDTIPAGILAGSPAGETVTADEPGLPAGGAPFVSLWAVDPATGGLIHLPHALKVDLSPIRNSGGSFRFDYPAFGKNFEFLHRRLVEDQVAVELELWVGGSRFNALGGDVLQVEGDDVAEASVWGFAGKFFTHRLSWATVRHDPGAEKGERRFGAATAGTIMRTFLQEAQARGTLTDLTFATFSATHDSAGVPWANPVTLKFTPHADGGLLPVLSRLVALGLCEGEVDRDKRFLLYNSGGAGRDLTLRNPPVILRRAKDILESNRRIDVGESGTDVYGTGADGLYANTFDATARAKWGQQIEKVVDSNQIEDQAALTAFVQASRESVVLAPMELTHGLVFGTNRPAPVSGFRINDWLYSDVGRGLERVRVAQWVLSQDVSGIKGSVTLNDIIADRLTRLQRKLAALADGDAVVGTSIPPDAEDTLAPAVPTGVTVDSQAYTEGIDTYATLLVGWLEVNTNSDGTAADDVAGYRVQWRPQSESVDSWRLGQDAAGGATESTSFGGVAAGIDVLVRVAAYDTNGNQSGWSSEVVIATSNDDDAPPTPQTPTAFPYLGQIKVAYSGKGSAAEAMPADTDMIELHASTASNFTPTAATAKDTFTPNIAGERVLTDLDYGVTIYVRLVAQDRAGNRSAASAQASATPSKVVGDDVFDGAIGSAKLADLAVITAKIDNLAVNDAKFGSGSFGKLTAGTLSVAVTNAGIIRSGTLGQRYELDAAALRLYNTSGSQTVQLNGTLNWIMGEIRTAMSGTRMVLNPGGTQPDRINFYDSGGQNNVAYLYTYTLNGQAVLIGRGNSTRGDGKAGEFGAWPAEGYVRWVAAGSVEPNSHATARQLEFIAGGPTVKFEILEEFPNDGGTRRMEFFHRNSSGVVITNSMLYYQARSADDLPVILAPGKSGMLWANGAMGVIGGTRDSGNAEIVASAFSPPSSTIDSKEDIQEPVFGTDVALDVVRGALAKQYRYRPGIEAGGPLKRLWRWGPMVEHLAAFSPDLVHPNPIDGTPTTSLDKLIGVLWRAVAELSDEVEELKTGRRPGPRRPLGRLPGAAPPARRP